MVLHYCVGNSGATGVLGGGGLVPIPGIGAGVASMVLGRGQSRICRGNVWTRSHATGVGRLGITRLVASDPRPYASSCSVSTGVDSAMCTNPPARFIRAFNRCWFSWSLPTAARATLRCRVEPSGELQRAWIFGCRGRGNQTVSQDSLSKEGGVPGGVGSGRILMASAGPVGDGGNIIHEA